MSTEVDDTTETRSKEKARGSKIETLDLLKKTYRTSTETELYKVYFGKWDRLDEKRENEEWNKFHDRR